MQKNVSVKVRLRVKHLSTVILEKTDVRYTHVLGYWCFIVLRVRCLRHWRKGASPAIKKDRLSHHTYRTRWYAVPCVLT
jgi:hypothetical protein